MNAIAKAKNFSTQSSTKVSALARLVTIGQQFLDSDKSLDTLVLFM
jgi:hypothetical protein